MARIVQYPVRRHRQLHADCVRLYGSGACTHAQRTRWQVRATSTGPPLDSPLHRNFSNLLNFSFFWCPNFGQRLQHTNAAGVCSRRTRGRRQQFSSIEVQSRLFISNEAWHHWSRERARDTGYSLSQNFVVRFLKIPQITSVVTSKPLIPYPLGSNDGTLVPGFILKVLNNYRVLTEKLLNYYWKSWCPLLLNATLLSTLGNYG